MNIVYLKHSHLDKAKWDDCIKNAPNGNIYAYSWYLDIVCKNWDALVYEDYSAVFPISWKQKLGIKYICQPPFSQQLGIFSRNIISTEILQCFLNKINNLNYKIIEINLNKYNKDIPINFNPKPNITYELDLIYPYENIYENYSENTQRNIKKALSKEVYLSKYIRADDLINMFKRNRGKDISTLSDKDYNILHKIINQSIQKNCGEIWGGFNNDNELCAAAFFIQANGKVIFLFSATNQSGKENSAMFLIIDNYIKQNAEKPLVLDFEGSNNENLGRFYKSFGAKKFEYFKISTNKLPYIANRFYNLYKFVKYY